MNGESIKMKRLTLIAIAVLMSLGASGCGTKVIPPITSNCVNDWRYPNKDFGLEAVWSDGKFTYFKFIDDPRYIIPSVAMVANEESDDSMNTEVYNRIVRLNTTNKDFIISKNDKEYACVSIDKKYERKWYFLWLFKGEI